jgi:FkbM family methyltransferase
VIRAVGRWQFKLAPLRWLVERLTPRLTQRCGDIAHGIGAGLRFDATGGQPGFLLGTAEPEEQAVSAQHLVLGGVFYDIGANIGFYSTLAGRLVGPGGHVYGFEPTPASAAQAKRNAELNGFSHIEIVEVAASDSTGRMTLAADAGSATNHLTSTGDGIDVAVITIDSWRAQTKAQPPTVVMIDVEGSELRVLGGMLDTIRQQKPVILCEVHWIGGCPGRCGTSVAVRV